MLSNKQLAFVLVVKLDPLVSVVILDTVVSFVLFFMILDVFVKLATPMIVDLHC